jgi:hypothetical protein
MRDAALQALLDREAVGNVLHRYAKAIDSKDWALLETVFTEDVEADFRSFGGREVQKGRDTWVAAVKSTIAGLDATQHMTGNHVARVDGDRATLNAYIIAAHWLHDARGDGEYTVGGDYDIELRREADGWRICRYTLNVAWHRGNRDILRQATRKLQS